MDAGRKADATASAIKCGVWAEAADCIAAAWDADGWSWAEFYGGDAEREVIHDGPC